jgi:cyclohexa-1,5-dienecarbonyl-CoA hydratase
VSSPGLEVRLDRPVARLTLDRPPLNVLTTAMMRGLARALDEAAGTEGIHLVRIDAVGRAFCAGVDVGEHLGDALDPMIDALRLLFEALDRTPLVTVAVVHAAALGGGCELALGTDLCVAAEGAVLGQPEIKLGVFAPPASVLLPRLVGERRALGMLLGGEPVTAAEARVMGLVNEVFPDQGFTAAADAWIARLAALSGAALRNAKRAVTAARSLAPGEAHARVLDLYLDDMKTTQDAQEGLQAFLDKRAPVWRHR